MRLEACHSEGRWSPNCRALVFASTICMRLAAASTKPITASAGHLARRPVSCGSCVSNKHSPGIYVSRPPLPPLLALLTVLVRGHEQSSSELARSSLLVERSLPYEYIPYIVDTRLERFRVRFHDTRVFLGESTSGSHYAGVSRECKLQVGKY